MIKPLSKHFRGPTLFLMLVLAATLGPLIEKSKAAELIMLEQQHCPWCERWKAEIGPIYPKTTESKIAPLRMVDIHEPLPDDLRGMSKGRFTPTFVLMHEGKEIGRMRGYTSEDFFWALLDEMLKKLPTQSEG